jgi:hypothetical protein
MTAAEAAPAAHQSQLSATAMKGKASVTVRPDYTCPSRSVCVFSSNDWTGTAMSLATNFYAGPPWYTFDQVGWSGQNNPGSLTDNSGSAVWVYSTAHDADPSCYPGNEDWKAALNQDYGWFYITYGVAGCASDPPKPLPAIAVDSRGHVSARPVSGEHGSPHADFNCPGDTVCVFPNDNYSGNYGAPWYGPAKLGIDAYTNYWFSFASANITPNPGSLNNNYSRDCTWVYDKAAGPGSENPYPVEPDTKYDLADSYGYIYIQSGQNECPANAPAPLP